MSNLTDTRASRAVRILRLVRLGKQPGSSCAADGKLTQLRLYKFYQKGADAHRIEPLYAVPPGSPMESQPSQAPELLLNPIASEDWDLGSDKPDDQNEEAQQDSGQEETRCLAMLGMACPDAMKCTRSW